MAWYLWPLVVLLSAVALVLLLIFGGFMVVYGQVGIELLGDWCRDRAEKERLRQWTSGRPAAKEPTAPAETAAPTDSTTP